MCRPHPQMGVGSAKKGLRSVASAARVSGSRLVLLALLLGRTDLHLRLQVKAFFKPTETLIVPAPEVRLIPQ